MTLEDARDSMSGRAVAVIFSNAENGYTVLRLEGEDGLFTAVGCIPYPAAGEAYILYGEWGSHAEYGRQFTVSSFERRLPESPAHIEAFLASGLFNGVGRSTAKRIVERFGAEVFDILRDNPEALAEIRGITEEHAREIGDVFTDQYELRSLMEFTSQMGLSAETALRLHTRYSSAALGLLTDNPYLLIDDYFGIRFSDVDRFALQMGVAPNSSLRYEAALRATLIFNQDNGHVFLPRGKLCDAAAKLLALPDPLVMDDALESLIANGEVVRETVFREEACYMEAMYRAECGVAEKLLEAAGKHTRYDAGDAEPLIAAAECRLGIEYAPRQREAILAAAQNGVLVLTGGPGTGKTTAIRGILSVYEQMGLSVALAAPTGRAAKRITALTGAAAKTIHRLLEAGFTPDHTRSVFARNEDNPIDADAIIVDELSMVDLPLMYALLSAVRPGTRIVLVGDADQLPSVGPGNLLRDIIASAALPMVQLHEIFRQARQSQIVNGAHLINIGIAPTANPPEKDSDFFFMKRNRPEDVVSLVTELCRTRLPGYRGLTPADIQVIAPTKQRLCGTISLNQYLQAALNPKKQSDHEMRNAVCSLRVGDRVMQVVNDYELPWQRDDGSEAGLGVFNGDIGVIESIDERAGILAVRYDDRVAAYTAEQLRELELAYAVTVHKAQGSEFPCVILVAFDGPERLLTRNLLYTGFTRAKTLLVIVGRTETVSQMTANERTQKRYTALRMRLRRGGDDE